MTELLKKDDGVPYVMDIDTIQYEDMSLNDPIAVVGFPSVGLTSSIMANMYIKSLEMKPLIGMASWTMPPYCLVSDGYVMPPLRFFGYKNKRKGGHDVIVCMTEYAPKPEDCYAIVNRILTYFRSKGVKTVICMEGAPKFEKSKTLVVAAGPNSEALVKKTGLDTLKEGMIRGLTGIMMYLGPSKGMDVVSIMVPATSGVPDPGSSAEFIEPISKLIPGFKVKPTELLKEAAIIQGQIEEAQHNMEDTSQYIG